MNRIWNKSHRNNCSLLLILLLGFILWQTPVHASEFNFAVDFELPANQIDKNKTYINVRMEPGKTQEIPYTVFNRTDKSVTVETLIHSATTNSNGVIEYGESKSKFDETLSYDMKNLAKTVGEITVPPQSAVTETLSLKAPEKELAGVVAGGITFQEKKENVSNKSTVMLISFQVKERQHQESLQLYQINEEYYHHLEEFKHDYKSLLFSLKITLQENKKETLEFLEILEDHSAAIFEKPQIQQLTNIVSPAVRGVFLKFLEKAESEKIPIQVVIPVEVKTIPIDLVVFIRCLSIFISNAFDHRVADQSPITINLLEEKEGLRLV